MISIFMISIFNFQFSIFMISIFINAERGKWKEEIGGPFSGRGVVTVVVYASVQGGFYEGDGCDECPVGSH
jgi:hypothetical protein